MKTLYISRFEDCASYKYHYWTYQHLCRSRFTVRGDKFDASYLDIRNDGEVYTSIEREDEIQIFNSIPVLLKQINE